MAPRRRDPRVTRGQARILNGGRPPEASIIFRDAKTRAASAIADPVVCARRNRRRNQEPFNLDFGTISKANPRSGVSLPRRPRVGKELYFLLRRLRIRKIPAFGQEKGLLGFPVFWSTCFIESLTLPRSSKPSSLTFTSCPSFRTSDGWRRRDSFIWLI